MESEEVSGGNAAVVNFYTELGLDRTWAVDQLQAKLQKLKLHWGRRASLAGKHGDEARERLSVIEAALNTFSDEDAKERYDYRLRHADSVASDDEVNWVARAWTYYFAEDYDAAAVAARKARERGSSDPAAYVVSAWIELAQYQAERASHQDDYAYLYDDTPAEQGFAQRAGDYASEAYVLDENGDNAFEVQEVRGVVFYVMKKYDRAIEALKKALTLAQPAQLSGVYLWLARAQYELRDYKKAFLSCLAGLQEDKEGQLEEALVKCACLSVPHGQGKGRSFCILFNSYTLSYSAGQVLRSYLDKVVELEELQARHKAPGKAPSWPDFPIYVLLLPFFDLFALMHMLANPSWFWPRVVFFVLITVTVVPILIYIPLKCRYIEAMKTYRHEKAQYEADRKRILALHDELRQP